MRFKIKNGNKAICTYKFWLGLGDLPDNGIFLVIAGS